MLTGKIKKALEPIYDPEYQLQKREIDKMYKAADAARHLLVRLKEEHDILRNLHFLSSFPKIYVEDGVMRPAENDSTDSINSAIFGAFHIVRTLIYSEMSDAIRDIHRKLHSGHATEREQGRYDMAHEMLHDLENIYSKRFNINLKGKSDDR